MLISFAVENFLSFKDRQELSMIADKDEEMEDTHCFSPGSQSDLKLLKSAAVFGANASGKSNLIKAILFMREFIVHSTSREKIGEATGFIPFKLDRKKVNEPGLFEIHFLLEKKAYIYGFKIDAEKIIDEWLYFYPQNKKVLLFKRSIVREENLKLSPGDREADHYRYRFGKSFKGEKNKIKSLVRENSLYLTVGAQFAHPILTKIFNWFDEFLKPGITAETIGLAGFTSGLLDEDVSIKKKVISLLKSADLGIKDIKVEKIKKEQIKEFDKLPEPLRKGVGEGKFIDIEMVHSALSDNEEITANIDLSEESMGTQRMFQLSGPLFHVLAQGGALIIDELEDSLHFILLKTLLAEFFENSRNSQIIFTTHNVQLLEDRLFRRDEIWMTEKREDGGTELFSLADFKPKPRKDKSLKNGYLNGAYGALPVLGDLLGEQSL